MELGLRTIILLFFGVLSELSILGKSWLVLRILLVSHPLLVASCTLSVVLAIVVLLSITAFASALAPTMASLVVVSRLALATLLIVVLVVLGSVSLATLAIPLVVIRIAFFVSVSTLTLSSVFGHILFLASATSPSASSVFLPASFGLLGLRLLSLFVLFTIDFIFFIVMLRLIPAILLLIWIILNSILFRFLLWQLIAVFIVLIVILWVVLMILLFLSVAVFTNAIVALAVVASIILFLSVVLLSMPFISFIFFLIRVLSFIIIFIILILIFFIWAVFLNFHRALKAFAVSVITIFVDLASATSLVLSLVLLSGPLLFFGHLFHDVYIISKLFLTVLQCCGFHGVLFWLSILLLLLVIFERGSSLPEVEAMVLFLFLSLLFLLPLLLEVLLSHFFIVGGLFIAVFDEDVLVLLQIYFNLLVDEEIVIHFPLLSRVVLTEVAVASKGVLLVFYQESESNLVVLPMVAPVVEVFYLIGFERFQLVHHLAGDVPSRKISFRVVVQEQMDLEIVRGLLLFDHYLVEEGVIYVVEPKV